MLPSQPQQMPAWLLAVLDGANDETHEMLDSFVDKVVFHDNIHGAIWLNRVEVRVINTPEFQRLRKISQLAFAQYVFNTAEHSRFSHSLGACLVSKGLVDIVNDKMAQTWRKSGAQLYFKDTFEKLQHLHTCGANCSKHCPAQNLPAHYQTITWTERIIISLATLLHDLPHCPFSHDIEGGYPSYPVTTTTRKTRQCAFTCSIRSTAH